MRESDWNFYFLVIGDPMASKINKFFDKLYMGKEKSEDFARASLPTNRWELFWDIFKGRFWKLVLINLLTLIFLAPIIFLIYVRYVVAANYGMIYPYAQGFGVGYQAPISMVGFEQGISYNVNMLVFSLLPVVAFFAAFGIAGGAYAIRNIVWTEGYFVVSDFWRGIKKNFKQIILIMLLYSFVLYSIILSISYLNQFIALGANAKWLWIILEVLAFAILTFVTVLTLHMVEMSVTYEYSFRHLFRNSFIFTVSTFLPSIVLIAIGLLPFFPLFTGDSWFIVGLLLTVFLGFSFLMLMWTVFCQWGYDTFINPRMKNVKVNRGIYQKVRSNKDEELRKYKSQVQAVKTSFNSTPIKPITDDELKLAELPSSFNRSDIEKLNKSRQEIIDDHKRYVEEHKNESKYDFTALDKQRDDERLEREKRIEQAKRALAKRDREKKK